MLAETDRRNRLIHRILWAFKQVPELVQVESNRFLREMIANQSSSLEESVIVEVQK